MSWTIDEIVDQKRETTADYHAYLAQSWRRIGEPKRLHSPLAYAAFEYRLAIERIALELYYLMKREHILPKGGFSEEELKKTESFSSLVSLICEDQGSKLKLYRALTFNRAWTEVFTPLRKTLSIPEVGKLHNYWQRLSDWCHRQTESSETWESSEWVRRGYSLLNEVETYIWDLCVTQEFGWVTISSLPQELLREREQYMNGELTESELKKRLQILKPVLDLKKGRFGLIGPVSGGQCS